MHVSSLLLTAERPEERPPRRNLIRLALRAVQMPCLNVPFDLKGAIEARPTILSRGKIRFSCELNKNAVRYGEPLEVKVVVQNNSRSSIRKVVVRFYLGVCVLCYVISCYISINDHVKGFFFLPKVVEEFL